jgi:hypothetical protein
MYKILIHKSCEKSEIDYRFEIVTKQESAFKQRLSDADMLSGEYLTPELAKIAAKKWINNRKKRTV